MISVLTVVYNEEELLPLWLDHYGAFDVTVLVDGKTTDGTRELLDARGIRWSEIHFPNGWCEETRKQKELEWYRHLPATVTHAILVDVDEFIRPLERLGKYVGENIVIAPWVHMVDGSRGIYADPNRTKPILIPCGISGLSLSWGHHLAYGRESVEAEDLVLCHLKYHDYELCWKRRFDRPKFKGNWGQHWVVEQETFRVEFEAAHRRAVDIEVLHEWEAYPF